MGITVQDWELLAFFEVEPELTDEGFIATYVTRTGNYEVRFSLSAAYSDFILSIRNDDALFFEVAAKGVLDVRYRKVKEVEVLEMLVREKHEIGLILRPTLRIEEKIGRYS